MSELFLYKTSDTPHEEALNDTIYDLFRTAVVEQLIQDRGEQFLNSISGYNGHFIISEKILQMYLERGTIDKLTCLVGCELPTPFEFAFNTFNTIEEMVFDDKHRCERRESNKVSTVEEE